MGQSGGTAQKAGKGQGTASPSASAELVVEFEDATGSPRICRGKEEGHKGGENETFRV